MGRHKIMSLCERHKN